MIALLVTLALAQEPGPPTDEVECTGPTRTATVRTALDAAYAGLQGLDITAFKAATDRLDAALPCLNEALPPTLVAEIHRTKGIRAFGERDAETAGLMWAAARSIEPGYRFPYNLIPDGNPIREGYLSVDLADRTVESMEAPNAGDLRFDGYSTLDRPSSFPALVQYIRSDGAVDFTVYLTPSDAVPDYPTGPLAVTPAPVPRFPMPSPVPVPKPELPPPARKSARTPLWVAAGVTAVASGITYGMAGASKNQFIDPATPDADLDRLRSRTNTLVIVSGFGGAAAAGLTIAGFTAK